VADTTGIAWCDETWNPWWGCNEVSEGCDNCYARTWTRFTRGPGHWGPPNSSDRILMQPREWRKPIVWNRRVEQGDTNWRARWQPPHRPDTLRRLVFCASMADIFEYHPMLDALRSRLWNVIEQTPNLDWLLLTKRPMNIRRMLPAEWLRRPRPNVWLGTSVELQRWAERRIEHLLDVPATVHFISAEPLLGPLDLTPWLGRVNWVISGGESGTQHRPLDIEWVRDLDAQCRVHHVAHFFKQHGGRSPMDGGCDVYPGIEVKNFPQPRLRLAA